MLKHATISRTSRAQQTLQLQRQCQENNVKRQNFDQCQSGSADVGLVERQISELLCSNQLDSVIEQHLNDANTSARTPSPQQSDNSSPTPSLVSIFSTPVKQQRSSTSSSSPSSPMQHAGSHPNATDQSRKSKCNSESMIKVFAQTLSQDVEYVTLHVNTQTKSNQIVKNLLRKFRLKHRDPNLFYLTLERWIRKDGLKFRSAMLLGDEACPLQLQQCCSNPPHNDIKFTLQMRTGALVKIFCSDVVPDAHYKCLSLSTQTTVEETIELMLHCLNLLSPINVSAQNHHARLSGSPAAGSTNSSTSSSSISSSSGIESEPNCNHALESNLIAQNDRLDSDSRTNSVTSISSNSNVSSISGSLIDQYCLVIECEDTNFKRMLEPDEYLVDVYQNLLIEANEQMATSSVTGNYDHRDGAPSKSSKQVQIDQWFSIKLKKRNCHSNHSIKFANPRQNVPLPPIPPSLAQFNNANSLQHIVSTAQIEVNCGHNLGIVESANSELSSQPIRSISLGHAQKSSLPPEFILLPPIVRPRRRNPSNVSSTFGKPLMSNNRRRYDPIQLAEDLSRLDLKEPDCIATN